MKVWFHAFGWRETKTWSCKDCNNFFTCGADIAVDEAVAFHKTKCPSLNKDSKLEAAKKYTQILIDQANFLMNQTTAEQITRSYYNGQLNGLKEIKEFMENL